MTIKYFDTLYEREDTMHRIDEIEFNDTGIVFSHMGFRVLIPYHNVISISDDEKE